MTGTISFGGLRTLALCVLAGTEAVLAALAVYVAVQVKETLLEPYRFEACSIAALPSSDWFYPDIILSLSGDDRRRPISGFVKCLQTRPTMVGIS